jgi:hypothetical protein
MTYTHFYFGEVLHERVSIGGKDPICPFTRAVKARSDGKYSVAIAQCPSDKICAKSLGKKMASKKLSEGRYMVKELPELQELADKLAEKICTGNVKLRIDISHIVPRNNP